MSNSHWLINLSAKGGSLWKREMLQHPTGFIRGFWKKKTWCIVVEKEIIYKVLRHFTAIPYGISPANNPLILAAVICLIVLSHLMCKLRSAIKLFYQIVGEKSGNITLFISNLWNATSRLECLIYTTPVLKILRITWINERKIINNK